MYNIQRQDGQVDNAAGPRSYDHSFDSQTGPCECLMSKKFLRYMRLLQGLVVHSAVIFHHNLFSLFSFLLYLTAHLRRSGVPSIWGTKYTKKWRNRPYESVTSEEAWTWARTCPSAHVYTNTHNFGHTHSQNTI